MLISYEPVFRLGGFVLVLTSMALWEVAAPRRARSYSRARRWPNNFAIVSLNTVLRRLLLPSGAVGLALLARERGWGLLNNTSAPTWVAIATSVILLDLAVYLQHVTLHAVPAL